MQPGAGRSWEPDRRSKSAKGDAKRWVLVTQRPAFQTIRVSTERLSPPGTETLRVTGTFPLGFPGARASIPSSRAAHRSGADKGRKLKWIHPREHPPKMGRGMFWLRMGGQVPGLGPSPAAGTLIAEGLMWAGEGGEAAPRLFCPSSRWFSRVFQAIPLSLVPCAFSPACPSFCDFEKRCCLVLLSALTFISYMA